MALNKNDTYSTYTISACGVITLCLHHLDMMFKKTKKTLKVIKKVRTKSLLMCLRPCICVNTDLKVNNNIIWTINFFLHSETNLIHNSSVANLKISTKQIDLGSFFMSKMNQVNIYTQINFKYSTWVLDLYYHYYEFGFSIFYVF